MSTVDRKELMNEVYDAALYTGGVFLIGMTSKKLLKEPLGTPSNFKDALKLSVAMAGGLMLAKFAQSKKWLPTDPFDSK